MCNAFGVVMVAGRLHVTAAIFRKPAGDTDTEKWLRRTAQVCLAGRTRGVACSSMVPPLVMREDSSHTSHVLVARSRCAQALQVLGGVVRLIAVAHCGGSNFWLAARALALWNGFIVLSFTALLWWLAAPDTYLPYGSSLQESVALGIFFVVVGAIFGPMVRQRVAHTLRLESAVAHINGPNEKCISV